MMLLNWFVAIGFVSFGISKPNVAVPEPSTNILFLLAVLGLTSVKYKKKLFKY